MKKFTNHQKFTVKKKRGGGGRTVVNVKEVFISMGHRLNWGLLQKEKGKYPELLLGRNMTCNPTVPLKAMNTDCHSVILIFSQKNSIQRCDVLYCSSVFKTLWLLSHCSIPHSLRNYACFLRHKILLHSYMLERIKKERKKC